MKLIGDFEPVREPDSARSASMRDVLSRRCAEQAVEIAGLREECQRLRVLLAKKTALTRNERS